MKHALACLAGAIMLAAAAPPPPAEEEAPAGPSARMLSTSHSYVRMEPVAASVRAGAYMGGMLEVEFALDIPDEALRATVASRNLRLRDAYVTALTSYGGLGYRAGQVPDFVRITRILQLQTDRTLGTPGAEVLIRSIALHEP